MARHDGHDKLLALAKERSKEKRLTLLREITDMFMERPDLQKGDALKHVDDILVMATGDLDTDARAEVSERLQNSAVLPPVITERFLDDDIRVAGPLLSNENGATDDVLKRVGQQGALTHVRSLASRPRLKASVSATIVARRDSEASTTLVKNRTAKISRSSFETLRETSDGDTALQSALVERDDTPPDLLNEMYLSVSGELRSQIVDRNETMNSGDVALAVQAARQRLQKMAHFRSEEEEDARRYVQAHKLRKSLEPELLPELLEEKHYARFAACFSELTNLDLRAAHHVMTHPSVTLFATACKAAHFETELFVPLAILRPCKATGDDADPEAITELYKSLKANDAKRVLRFWRLRQSNAGARSPNQHAA